jgi:hypothetical protein
MSEKGNKDYVWKAVCPTSLSSSQKWQARGATAFVLMLCVSAMMMVDVQFIHSETLTAETLQDMDVTKDSSETPSSGPSILSCLDFMNLPPPYFSSGDFLTNPTLPHAWVPRADGSHEFQHGWCKIHRYTADEARQCLVGKHVSIIGDSVSRYGGISLAYFLHKGEWPSRFGIELPYCRRHDENGTAVCSKADEPNILIEPNFNHAPNRPDMDKWDFFMAKLGGWTDGSTFNGRLECNCPGHRSENWIYVTPELLFASKHVDGINEYPNLTFDGVDQYTNRTFDGDDQYANRIVISFNFERGTTGPWPLYGFNSTGCALTGTCRHSQTDAAYWMARFNSGTDWSQDLLDFLSPNRFIASQLPPVDIAIYNRGLWNTMEAERSKQVLPLLYSYSGGANGRCFYRTTVNPDRRAPEMEYVRADTLASTFWNYRGSVVTMTEIQTGKRFYQNKKNATAFLSTSIITNRGFMKSSTTCG